MTDHRASIRAAKFQDEHTTLQSILSTPPYNNDVAHEINRRAIDLVRQARCSNTSKPILDTFLSEYGLSNSEGIALMCLAESLLRVPDAQTADLLIADKLGCGDWSEHLGHADSLLVNASTWALMLTGRLVELPEELLAEPLPWFRKLVARTSEPVIQAAVRTAMEILGREFVLGETIEKAIQRCQDGMQYSFDMLGEAARDAQTARRYFDNYLHAITNVASDAPGASVSIKLSALHPRYEESQRERVMAELVPDLLALCEAAADRNVNITIDAEESDRLELSLDILQLLIEDHQLSNVGCVVQAYSKRAPHVIDWLIDLAEQTRTSISVRLVKGAYWDAEIKHAQVEGLPGFPVYTRKEHTDVAYLHCARKILEHPCQLYGQFATHNAHTLAAIMVMGQGRQFEFQRLHGMGEMLFSSARQIFATFPPVRTYAPVGCHEDLLAYLVRRLLENGANSSFVNRFLDENVTPASLVQDPVALVANGSMRGHPDIYLPEHLFPGRLNSVGQDLNDPTATTCLESRLIDSRRQRQTMLGGADRSSPISASVRINSVPATPIEQLDLVVRRARAAQGAWNRRDDRALILNKMAALVEENGLALISLLVDEAGKTLPDAVNEVREAVDFCRYYAEGISAFECDASLPGPTGEDNLLSWQGRGVWVCISPWNFPLAIFLGQVSAALAAGNSVIAKPAEETPLVAARCVALLWEAGVPEDVCQLVTGGSSQGQYLVEHVDIAGVAFTGSNDTARHINIAMAAAPRPIVPLIAETGGQNAMLIDSTALLEQVVDDVIDSAFRSAGQRCSALRVLFVQEEIAETAIELITGAMNELRLGDPRRVSTDIGPVISASAAGRLNAHIEELRKRGFLRHQCHVDATHACPTGQFVTPTLAEIPSINYLRAEHFGPILHVVRFAASEIDQVIDSINETRFGLTFGIHTRIAARADYVSERMNVGNVYVNRNITGAVVGSQPFGGQGYSGTGPKAGGPNYLKRFAVEKVVTTNTVATGGNAALLNLEA